jgi:hypothetical protein
MLNFQVQLDMFNAVPHIASFDIGDRTDVKIFEYSDDLKFDDKILEDNFIVNVPMYKIEDIMQLMQGQNEVDKHGFYFNLAKNKKLNHCLVRITDEKRYGCGDKWYLLANAQTKKFITKNAVFGILKETVKKLPKVYKKCVKITDSTYRKDLKRNFVSVHVQSKHMSEHVISQVS